MPRLAPFREVRYDPDVAGPPVETSAPAHGTVDPFAVARHRTANPYTVLGLLTRDVGATIAERHAGARESLQRWLRTGVLVRAERRCLGVYRQVDVDGQAHVGVLGALDVSGVDDGTLLLHEDVDPRRVRARAARLSHVPVDVTPILTVHREPALPAAVAAAVTHTCAGPPDIDMTDEQGVGHQVWLVRDPDWIATVVDGLRDLPVVLADGHHRVAAARQLGRHDGGGGSTLALVTDSGPHGLSLRAIHRLVWTAHPDPAGRLRQAAGVDVRPWAGGPAGVEGLGGWVGAATDPDQHRFGLLAGESTWCVAVTRSAFASLLAELAIPDPLRDLDVTLLQEGLYPVLGTYHDQAAADLAGAVAHLRDGGADLLSAGSPADALLLCAPPSAAQVFAVAEAGLTMPAKSTWFHPKPRAGLVMRLLEDDGA